MSVETYTFVAAWGEFGPPLEDVAMLTSLPMFGEAHAASLYPDYIDKKRIKALQTTLSKTKYSINKATYLLWVKYFDEGDGMNCAY